MDLSGIPAWQRRNWSTEVSTAPRLLAALADDDDVDVRTGVAENYWTPAEILTRLARDRSSAVRLAVAANRRTPSVVQGQLADDDDPDVRRQATTAATRPDEAV